MFQDDDQPKLFPLTETRRMAERYAPTNRPAIEAVRAVEQALRAPEPPSNPLVVEVALKHDEGKLRMELLPVEALEDVARVLGHGAIEYGEWNWAKGFNWARLIGAAQRHLTAFTRGEDLDGTTGLSHIAHALCCLMFLEEHFATGNGVDDRRVSRPRR